MDWLLSIDVCLFRLINQHLRNPVFDLVMPIFAGSSTFIPALLVFGVFLVWKGGVRGRLCLLFLVASIWMTDSVVCHTLKEVVGRPRPFLALENVHVLVGRGGSGSMPSSHAANWFAATLVAFVFYRRSLPIMLGLASVVGFSRVYNGVHYPSDVLAGAALGGGTAVAVMWLTNAFWLLLGPRWFPIWWRRLPSLVDPRPRPAGAAAAADNREQSLVRLGYLIIALIVVARLIYLASGKIELSEDEAYQWLWSKHPALSYYSKPPLIAVAQWIGTALWGDNAFGVRFLSPIIAGVASFITFRFFSRESSARTALLILLMTCAVPLLAVGSILMTVDPLLVLFWTAAMFSGWRAIHSDEPTATRLWLWTGLWMGLGFLSKYTALFQVVCWGLFFWLWKPARRHLRTAGPYLALVVMMLCTIPVLIWNARHGWITVEHVGTNAGRTEPWQPTLRYFWDFLGEEAVLLNPFFFMGMMAAMIAVLVRLNRFRREHPLSLYCFCMGAPVFLGYLLFTFYKRVFPNWIAPAVLPLLFLSVLFWENYWGETKRRLKPVLALGLGFGFLVVVVLHDTNLIEKATGHYLPTALDPLHRVRAWRATATTVGHQRDLLAREEKPAFIITDHYGYTSEITFYLPEARRVVGAEPLVYYKINHHPQNQFYFWPEYRYWEHRKGQNAIYVKETATSEHAPAWLKDEFSSVQDLGVFLVKYGSRDFRRIQLFACRNLR